MGMMVEGKWTKEWYKPDGDGRFVRPETVFRGRVTADGSSGFRAEAGRYHLYVSLACPWAHRVLIMRKLKGLEKAITLSVVDPFMGDGGWAFSDAPGCIPDTVTGSRFLREVYLKAQPGYTGRVTVPVLFDRETKKIVNNESRDVMRMLDLEFGAVASSSVTYCPENLCSAIDSTIDRLYEPVNNGVYRAGFAVTQAAYDEAVKALFDALDGWDFHLSKREYLLGDVITEADICLFTTLIRFDAVYYTHFKCNLRHIYEYRHLWRFLRAIYLHPGVAETCNFEHIKRHYFESHRHINPSGIVPAGPMLRFC